MNVLKMPLIIVVVLFVTFYLMQDPQELAHFSQNTGIVLWKLVSTLFGAIVEFLNTLLG